jgi:hypothetical protein
MHAVLQDVEGINLYFFLLVTGLVDGLSVLRKSPDQFVQIASLVALRMLLRCDDAVGSSRKLLRLKWRSALVEGSRSSTAGGSGHPSPAPGARSQDDGDLLLFDATPQKPQQRMGDAHDTSMDQQHRMLLSTPQSHTPQSHHQAQESSLTLSELQRVPYTPVSSNAAPVTPFSSSRLGGVRTHMHQQQQMDQHQSQHPRSPQLLQQSHSLVAPSPAAHHRWDPSSSSSTPSRPPPYASTPYKDFVADKDVHHGTEHSGIKPAFGGDGAIDRESSWASARETRPGSGYFGSSDTSLKSPYSSTASGNSVGYSGNTGAAGMHFLSRTGHG